MIPVDIYTCIVRSSAVRFGEHSGPVQFETVRTQERMLSLQSGIEYILMIPLHPHCTFLIVVTVTDFAFPQVHIPGIQHQFVPS